MASSPTDRDPAPSRRAFALQEATVCWNQGYEALARGDLDRVAALLDVADDHLRVIGDPAGDSPDEARCRREAAAARGRLEHGMRAGLQGIADELAAARHGNRVLRGYGAAVRASTSRLRGDA